MNIFKRAVLKLFGRPANPPAMSVERIEPSFPSWSELSMMPDSERYMGHEYVPKPEDKLHE